MADETANPEAPTQVNGEEPTTAMLREWDPILKLSAPLELKNKNGAVVETITELKFREPKGRDIEDVGIPVLPNFRFDTIAMGEMIARLAGVPPSTIKALPARDWTTAAYKLWDFFLPGPR